MEKLSGVGLFKFQKDLAKEEAGKKLQMQQMQTTSDLLKANKKKDALIQNLFMTVNKLTKEIKELKEEE